MEEEADLAWPLGTQDSLQVLGPCQVLDPGGDSRAGLLEAFPDYALPALPPAPTLLGPGDRAPGRKGYDPRDPGLGGLPDHEVHRRTLGQGLDEDNPGDGFSTEVWPGPWGLGVPRPGFWARSGLAPGPGPGAMGVLKGLGAGALQGRGNRKNKAVLAQLEDPAIPPQARRVQAGKAVPHGEAEDP